MYDACVSRIDNARTNINTMLTAQARTRGDTDVAVIGDLERQAGRHKTTLACRNHLVLYRMHVTPCVFGRGAFGHDGIGVAKVDLELGGR